jgi:hypothetical protein
MSTIMQGKMVVRASAPAQSRSAASARFAAPRPAALRRSVALRSAATDAIIESMKTLTVRHARSLALIERRKSVGSRDG